MLHQLKSKLYNLYCLQILMVCFFFFFYCFCTKLYLKLYVTGIVLSVCHALFHFVLITIKYYHLHL